jgi:hypothetical protein
VGLSETRVEETDEKNRNFPTAQLAQHLLQLTRSGAATRWLLQPFRLLCSRKKQRDRDRERKESSAPLPRVVSPLSSHRTITNCKVTNDPTVTSGLHLPIILRKSGREASRIPGYRWALGSHHLRGGSIETRVWLEFFGLGLILKICAVCTQAHRATALLLSKTRHASGPTPHHSRGANSDATFACVCDWKGLCE